ncbi:hypothetical protein [Campylobacter concisus]|uniref:hypothetical protein n=1 Tax=Campylobacter concisus TaxID=199 RepID=UPI000CD9C0F3|nr:hypothetical protein [Campylobacter concisus]
MQLYNLKENFVDDKPYIVTDKGTFYTEFLTEEELKELGYLKVIYKDYPANTDEFKKVVQISEVKGDTYVISYEIVSKNLEELTALFKEKTQELLDAKAREKGYDDILSACSYAGYDNDFRAEGEAFGIWRAKVWKYGYGLLNAIAEGKHKMPKSFDEILTEMPTLEEVHNG